MNALEAIVRLNELKHQQYTMLNNSNYPLLVEKRLEIMSFINSINQQIQTIKDNNPKWHSPTQQ